MGTGARIDRASWTPPAIFAFLEKAGGVARDEMFRAFNMGIGLILACAPGQADLVSAILSEHGEHPIPVGEIAAGDRTVELD